jgi:hypothetical protein
VSWRALVALCLAAAPAAASPPVIAAIAAPPGDARAAIAIGPAGEAYVPDGKGAWLRRAGIGLADDVIDAARAGDVAIAGVKAGAPYELVPAAPHQPGGWSVMNLGLHPKAVLGRGPRAVAAVGKTVFVLERGKAVKLADAPGVITALAASAKGVVVETDLGLARLDGAKWKPLAKAPKHVVALLDAKWALVDHGVVELDSGKVTPWPAGFHPLAEVAIDGAVIGASAHELVTIRPAAITRDPIGQALASPIVGLAADRSGRVLIATRAGQLALRVNGTWSAGELRTEPAAEHVGSPPAEQP